MPKLSLLLLIVTTTTLTITGAENPVSIGTPALSNSPVFEGTPAKSEIASRMDKLPALSPSSVGRFQSSRNGTRFLVLRFRSPGATALRLRIRNMHLPQGARLFVYGLSAGTVTNISGPWTGAGPGFDSDFWTGAVRGAEAAVEFQPGDEEVSTLPFEVSELAWADGPSDPEWVVTRELLTANFRGHNLTYEAVDGQAIFESDIVLGDVIEMAPERSSGKGQDRFGIGIAGSQYRWPNGRIPYNIDPLIPNPERVANAIAHWNTMMAGVVSMVPRTTERAWLYFGRHPSNSTCSANVGMLGLQQYVWVGDSCATGNLIHEIGHSFGLWHEQSREDRNLSITINTSNIQASAMSNFNQNINDGDDLNTYDYSSIMHYAGYAFSSNGKPTIETVPAGITIGQRYGLSAGDMAAIRAMYPPPPGSLVTVTVDTNPTGMPFTVDAVPYKGLTTFQYPAGSTHVIAASTVPIVNGVKTAWARWSDGGLQSHTVTVPATATALVADYATTYNVKVTSVGSGSTTINPGGGYYLPDTVVNLSATGIGGNCFTGWVGLIPGTSPLTTLTVTQPFNLQAVYQTGAVTLSPTTPRVPVTGGTVDIGITASTGCMWAFKTTTTWIRPITTPSGADSGVMTLQVDPNTTGASRNGTVTIGGKNITVMQAAS